MLSVGTMSDEFEFGSDDDGDFLAAEAVALGKRKREDDIASTSKKNKPEPSASRILAKKVLKEQFGLNGFRMRQEDAITRLLDGGSAVIVFPTGAGKSLCYQVIQL
jgi:superfamily II DNA helicase RecQ